MIDAGVLEANYLAVLWAARDQPESFRLMLLRRLAEVVIPRDEHWYPTMRAETLPEILEGGRCFVCGLSRLEIHRHHVIQVQHGGSNSVRNLVPLCRACHADVHPWLPRVLARGGWTCVSEMARGVLDSQPPEKVSA